MSDLTLGLLGVLLATNQPQAISNAIQQQTGMTVAIPADATIDELRSVMQADDDAQDDVNQWIRDFDALGTNRTSAASADLTRRIRARFDEVRAAYDRFLRRHPDSAKGYLAYGSFLHDIGDPEGAKVQYENSRQLDPKNPAVWNNLANYYGEFSPVTNAFAYYAEAIRLEPDEPVYYQNFATTVYLFRMDAKAYYHINEQQVFDKALGLYRDAMKLAPNDLVLATDYAMSYYGIQPLRTNDALAAWTNALRTAHTEVEREGVEVHLARVNGFIGRFDEARAHLAAVTNASLYELKQRLARSLTQRELAATNPVAATTAAATTNVLSDLNSTNPPPKAISNLPEFLPWSSGTPRLREEPSPGK